MNFAAARQAEHHFVVKMSLLIQLVRKNPAVRSCIQRVFNEIVPSVVRVLENGKELTPALQRFLGPWLSHFLEHGLEMAYMCGFVVFVHKRQEGINVPVLLPLGSFTWSVEMVTSRTSKRKREHTCLYRYNVRPLHPEVKVEDLFVFNFQEPTTLDANMLPSPMDSLLDFSTMMYHLTLQMQNVVEWNARKHITTSERVDVPKDQTTDGISLLDDFRRYLITGQHTGVNRMYMTMNGLDATMGKGANELASSWIQGTFKPAKQEPSTSVHVLPPNTDVLELASIDLKTNMLEIQELFQRQVIQFFHMTAQPDINAQNKRPYLQMSEVKYMRHMSRFASYLLRFAYACVFDVSETRVEVELNNSSGLNIDSADDIKALHETNILLPSDRLKLRKRLMQNV